MSVLAISLPVVGCLVGLVLAIELLDWGMRGRRIGDALHCRGCDYNLTGLQSDRCPECASLLDEKTIAIGARQRRRGAIAISTLILVGSSGWLGWMGYQEVRQFDRYRFYSAARLLEMADRDDLRALVELSAASVRTPCPNP